MIVDWNRGEVKKGQVFHFKNSLRPFIDLTGEENDIFFLDIDNLEIYRFDTLEYDDLFFYEKEDDEDFMGVKLAGKITWTK